jgi:hypothetical protein
MLTTEQLLEEGYIQPRQLSDGTWIAMQRLIFTTAIVTGLHEWGWINRYCYDDPVRVRAEFAKINSKNDEPTGWIAKRPQA